MKHYSLVYKDNNFATNRTVHSVDNIPTREDAIKAGNEAPIGEYWVVETSREFVSKEELMMSKVVATGRGTNR